MVARVAVLLCFLFAGQSWAEPLTLQATKSTPENNPHHFKGWVPRELLPVETIEALVPKVCSGAYLPVESSYGEPGKLILEGDKVFREGEGVIKVTGDAEVLGAGIKIYADEALVDKPSNVMHMQGNVRIYEQSAVILGNKLEINTDTGEWLVDGASFVQSTTRAQLSIEVLSRNAQGVFILEKSDYTTCEPDRKQWSIYGSTIELDYEEGWGTIVHAVIYVKGVPFFYFPWFRFPLDDRRHTGLLLPGIHVGGDKEFVYSQPLYLNLAPNYDMTITPVYYKKKGAFVDTQSRLLTGFGMNSLTYGAIDDKEYKDKRERTAFTHEGGFNLPIRTKVNYTEVSDIRFYDDLDFSFTSIREKLLDQYAEAGVAREGLRVTLGMYDYQPISGATTAYARLPELDGSYTVREGILGVDVAANSSDFAYRSLTEGELKQVEGVRNHLELRPGVYMRRTYGYFEGFVIGYQTNYELEGQAEGVEDKQSRNASSAVIKGGLVFDRPWDFLGKKYTQTLETDAQLLQTGYTQQDDIPLFTTGEPSFTYASVYALNRFSGTDRVGDTTQLSYGFSTSLLDINAYPFAEVKFGQIYYGNKRRVTLASDDEAMLKGVRYTREFSPIATQSRLQLGRNFILTSDLVYDYKQERNLLNRWNAQQKIGSRSFFNLGYNLIADEQKTSSEVIKNEQVSASGVLQLTTHWAGFGRSFYDIKQREFIERLAGLEYESCCWRVRFGTFDKTKFSDEETVNETGVLIQFHLKGLGGNGRSYGKANLGDLDQALENAIPGFHSRELYLPD